LTGEEEGVFLLKLAQSHQRVCYGNGVWIKASSLYNTIDGHFIVRKTVVHMDFGIQMSKGMNTCRHQAKIIFG
jgi:hypothetical protein